MGILSAADGVYIDVHEALAGLLDPNPDALRGRPLAAGCAG